MMSTIVDAYLHGSLHLTNPGSEELFLGILTGSLPQPVGPTRGPADLFGESPCGSAVSATQKFVVCNDKTSVVSADMTSVVSADKTSVVSADISQDIPPTFSTGAAAKRPPLSGDCLGDVLGDVC